ncbi:hypothetical protein DBR42_26905 [Pelomonas sp. HMWF004]|nr:hypothetical protein DBR42_26905 [Pelomonas sp. HMWF004]
MHGAARRGPCPPRRRRQEADPDGRRGLQRSVPGPLSERVEAGQRHIALWRGINVGKAKRLAMADLKTVLAGLGAHDVATLLNSGNAVFRSPAPLSAEQIRSAVAQLLGVDAAVILKTAGEWATIAAQQPIPEADDPSRLLVAVTADAATLQALRSLNTRDGDRLAVTAHAAYLWCGDGILQSTVATTLLKTLGDRGTTRNWATVQKLNALAQAAG